MGSKNEVFYCPCRTGSFLFDVKKKQKTPAENFCTKVSAKGWALHPQKFIRPDLGGTEMHCLGLAGRE